MDEQTTSWATGVLFRARCRVMLSVDRMRDMEGKPWVDNAAIDVTLHAVVAAAEGYARAIKVRNSLDYE